jgi:acetyl-CoA carboxylase biotin carboxyl carrier protein
MAAVWKVVVRLGDIVAAGDPLVILESMKYGDPSGGPADGTVAEIRVQAGAVVQEGDVFAVVE